MFSLERFPQERVVEQINLADREIVGRSPVSIDVREFGRRQWFVHETLYFLELGWTGPSVIALAVYLAITASSSAETRRIETPLRALLRTVFLF